MPDKKDFQVILIPDVDDGGFVVQAPALPGCIGAGSTREAAIADITEQIAARLEDGADALEVPLTIEVVTVSV